MTKKNEMEVARLRHIREHQSTAVLAELVAEEAVELSKECLKYARICRGESPTPEKLEDVLPRIVEEYTDVALTAKALGIEADRDIYDFKLTRWCDRLKNRNV